MNLEIRLTCKPVNAYSGVITVIEDFLMKPKTWRDRLTAEEKRDLAALDSQIDKMAGELGVLRYRRGIIQNRASARKAK
jgi:hypothetical protein